MDGGCGRLHYAGGRAGRSIVNILIIPEDFRKDQYLLKPLFSRLFSEMGKARIRLEVCQDPLLGGVSEALKSARLKEIVERYDGMTDLYILCVDRDGVVTRRQRLIPNPAD